MCVAVCAVWTGVAPLMVWMQEGGVDIALDGILRMEHTPARSYSRLRVVFVGHAVDESQPLKSVPDKESVRCRGPLRRGPCGLTRRAGQVEAKWLTLEQIRGLRDQGLLRGSEILDFAEEVAGGRAVIAPLSVLSSES